jgi:hypothetical protein
VNGFPGFARKPQSLTGIGKCGYKMRFELKIFQFFSEHLLNFFNRLASSFVARDALGLQNVGLTS